MRCWRYGVLFYMGGLVYMGVELLWRCWSHGSMFVVGGLCFLLIGHLSEMTKPLPLFFRTILGAWIITTLELAAGLLINGNYQVWDYRSLPWNFLGQICPHYSLLWIPVSLGANLLYAFLSGGILQFSQRRSLLLDGPSPFPGTERLRASHPGGI